MHKKIHLVLQKPFFCRIVFLLPHYCKKTLNKPSLGRLKYDPIFVIFRQNVWVLTTADSGNKIEYIVLWSCAKSSAGRIVKR